MIEAENEELKEGMRNEGSCTVERQEEIEEEGWRGGMFIGRLSSVPCSNISQSRDNREQ